MHVSSAFDGGNIEVLDTADPENIRLRIRKDRGSEFMQWFYFRLHSRAGHEHTIRIVDCDQVTYRAGFEDYRAVASYNRQDWYRVPTRFDGQVLTIRHRLEADSAYYAYFAPYSMERHADLIAATQLHSGVQLKVLGETLDGQDLDLLVLGEPDPERKSCWIIARQHPGETMAEWWMEGFLNRLTDGNDAVARSLLDQAVFYVVPNMNPDGSRRGHLRTNAAGANLNREWLNPTLERSPEVYLVRRQMHESGVDFALDVHGDEGLPYNFIAGFEGIPSLKTGQLALLDEYRNTLARLNPDFQTQHGYGRNEPGKANLSMCANYLAETFGCLSMTLEQPFKDSTITPDERAGWSPPRCRLLASSCLDALHAIVQRLR